MKKKIIVLSLIAVSVLFTGIATATAEERHEDHEQLRALLKTITVALNTRQLESLAPYIYKTFVFTTPDQKVFTDLGSIQAHINSFFGPTGLKELTFEPNADVLTSFIGQDGGLCYGTSKDTYKFNNGEVRVFNRRWTASLVKDKGQWKLVSLHSGMDILDNAYLDAVKRRLKNYMIFALGGGLIAGGFIGRLSARKAR